MIHGAGGGGWEYKFWKSEFEARGYRVIAPDLLPVAGDYAKTKFEDYVDQIVKAGGKTPDVLIGASMGGVLVMKAAEKLRPKALVVVCSTLPKGVLDTAVAKEPSPPVLRWKGGPYKDTVDSMPDSDEATRKFAWPRWRDESGSVMNTIRAGVTITKPKCPVLVVIPESDDTIPPDHQQKLAGFLGADSLRFKGMSHVGPLLSKRAKEVARAVLTWLKN